MVIVSVKMPVSGILTDKKINNLDLTFGCLHTVN